MLHYTSTCWVLHYASTCWGLIYASTCWVLHYASTWWGLIYASTCLVLHYASTCWDYLRCKNYWDIIFFVRKYQVHVVFEDILFACLNTRMVLNSTCIYNFKQGRQSIMWQFWLQIILIAICLLRHLVIIWGEYIISLCWQFTLYTFSISTIPWEYLDWNHKKMQLLWQKKNPWKDTDFRLRLP